MITGSDVGLKALRRRGNPAGEQDFLWLLVGKFYGRWESGRQRNPSGVFGMTAAGGRYGYGTVFEISADGGAFANLYDFTGTSDGEFPRTGLLIDGNTLYGTTSNSIFKISTDGSDFTCLTTNVIGASQLLLSLSGNTLYGTTTNAGTYGKLFSISTSGTGLTWLHDFTGGTNDGAFPNSGLETLECSNLFLNSSTTDILYGTTCGGGLHNLGMVFKVDTDGSNFTDLYDFTGGSDGANPMGGLLLTNNNTGSWDDGAATYLYGTTSTGGTNGGGTLFGLGPDGAGFKIFFSFGAANGAQPKGRLALANQVLFGTTWSGGTGVGTNGTVFSVNPDGTDFANLYSFSGSDGSSPAAGLAAPVVDDTWSIWSLDTTINVPEGMIINCEAAIDDSCALFVNGNLASLNPRGPVSGWLTFQSLPGLHPGQNDVRVVIGGSGDNNDYFTMNMEGFPELPLALYGTTSAGGSNSDGAVFEIDHSGLDTVLHNFTGAPNDGNGPIGDLVLSGSNLYGVTENGGIVPENGNPSGQGVIFSIGTNGSNYNVLYRLNGTNGYDGANPVAGLVLSGSTLYGTTEHGGTNGNGYGNNNANGYGTIFSIDVNGSNYQVLYNFGSTSSDGKYPLAPLLLVSNTLYGTTSQGGSNIDSEGTIFSIGANGSDYRVLYSFGATFGDGVNPEAGLFFSSNTLYGTTIGGGIGNAGTIFSFALGSTTDAVLHPFGGQPDGANPQAGLVLLGNTLYGTTARGGTVDDGGNGPGTLFSIGVGGSGYSTVLSFDSGNGDNGIYPQADLLIRSNLLYGTTFQGGANGVGMVFSVNTNGSFNDTYDFQDNSSDGQNPDGGVASP